MDFPKSMPDIGLVNGQFVDEDVTTGQVGTYIPSSWGNALTHEILNVIEAAGLEPDEGDNTQLMVAVNKISSRYAPVLRHVSESKTLLSSDLGLVLVDASLSAVSLTLPSSAPELGVRDLIVHRVDSAGNRLKVLAAGNEKIKLHTHLNAAGYPFLILMGAGDWWHLRSDGAGNWWPVGRNDSTPLGRVVFDTTTGFPSGGYGAISGTLFDRVDWPWLWDHAQQSGQLTTETALAGNEGSWTSGDGVLTFRGPEARGEFLRILDENRGVDVGRVGGSWKADEIKAHTHKYGNTHSTTYGLSSTGVVGLNPAASVNYNTSSIGGIETRPRSIAYPGRIKLI